MTKVFSTVAFATALTAFAATAALAAPASGKTPPKSKAPVVTTQLKTGSTLSTGATVKGKPVKVTTTRVATTTKPKVSVSSTGKGKSAVNTTWKGKGKSRGKSHKLSPKAVAAYKSKTVNGKLTTSQSSIKTDGKSKTK